MSRTKKGTKTPTKEYWSARPGNKHGAVPGRISKEITKGKERAQSKEELRALEEDAEREMGLDRPWKE